MKQYHELTEEQQVAAVEFAERTMKESLDLGILAANKPFSSMEIHELALAAAEEGNYDDEGKPTVEMMEVPYYFLGGCV